MRVKAPGYRGTGQECQNMQLRVLSRNPRPVRRATGTFSNGPSFRVRGCCVLFRFSRVSSGFPLFPIRLPLASRLVYSTFYSQVYFLLELQNNTPQGLNNANTTNNDACLLLRSAPLCSLARLCSGSAPHFPALSPKPKPPRTAEAPQLPIYRRAHTRALRTPTRVIPQTPNN